MHRRQSPTFGQVPLWVPDYTSGSSPALPPGWANWAFWQYTSSGTVSGIQAPGNTDLDQLNPGQISLLDPVTSSGGWHPVHLQIAPADPVSGQTLTFSATGLPRASASALAADHRHAQPAGPTA